jgi:hypothetical protein
VAVLTGLELIAQERANQFAKGYDVGHDSHEDEGQLLRAAICYLTPGQAEHLWPWEKASWNPGDYVRNLAKAGALIAAELDRLQAAGQ